MKTQEEYAREIDEIVRRDVESCQSDWFKIDKEIFMQPKNKNKIFILGTRKTGCDLIILGGTNCDEGSMDWLFGSLGNENFYVCQPLLLQASINIMFVKQYQLAQRCSMLNVIYHIVSVTCSLLPICWNVLKMLLKNTRKPEPNCLIGMFGGILKI